MTKVGWQIENFIDQVREAVTALPADLFARYVAIIRRLEAGADPRDLGDDSKPMGDGLFEFRLQGKQTIGRVFHGCSKGQVMIVVHSIVKKTQATPLKVKDLELARERLREWKAKRDQEDADGKSKR